MVSVYGYIKWQDPTCQALIIPKEKVTNKKHWDLQADLWIFVLDNEFESVEAAYEFLENVGVVMDDGEVQQAYKHMCKCCGWYRSTEKIIGQRWVHVGSLIYKKHLFNGYACEQCIQEFESVKFEGCMVTPEERERIQIQRFSRRSENR